MIPSHAFDRKHSSPVSANFLSEISVLKMHHHRKIVQRCFWVQNKISIQTTWREYVILIIKSQIRCSLECPSYMSTTPYYWKHTHTHTHTHHRRLFTHLPIKIYWHIPHARRDLRMILSSVIRYGAIQKWHYWTRGRVSTKIVKKSNMGGRGCLLLVTSSKKIIH